MGEGGQRRLGHLTLLRRRPAGVSVRISRSWVQTPGVSDVQSVHRAPWWAAEGGPLGLGGGLPNCPHERRIKVFDCEILTEQEYSFIAAVCIFYTVSAPLSSSLRGLEVPSKTTIVSQSSLRVCFAAPVATAVRVSALWAMLGSTVHTCSCVDLPKFFGTIHKFSL